MFTPGSVIDGRYEILGPLGSGGMGQVFRARRIRLGDEVALKALHPGDLGPEAAERFLRESRACAQLRHPHIVAILDFDVDQAGHPFLVMELLSGPSLREELDLSGAFEPPRALAVLDAVAGAIQLAHDHGITHRDLKPANIVAHVYGSGERIYKVIDFGLASLEAAARRDAADAAVHLPRHHGLRRPRAARRRGRGARRRSVRTRRRRLRAAHRPPTVSRPPTRWPSPSR